MIARYKKYLKSDNKLTRHEKKEFIDSSVAKIYLIKTLLMASGYRPGYVGRSIEFLDSVEDYLKRTGKMSKKQRMALNQMYKRFKKKVELKGISNVQIEMKED